MRPFFISIFIFIFIAGSAQPTLVYPVRENHRWGYVTGSGKVVLEPKYDAIGDRNLSWNVPGEAVASDFRLVEADGLLGLLDGQLGEVLPPAYRQIRPLSDSLFAVAGDDHRFSVVNRTGKRVLDGDFEDVTLLNRALKNGPQFFKVKRNGRFGVFDDRGNVVLPMDFADVTRVALDPGFFKIKKTDDGPWGLTDHRGREVLPVKFEAILPCSENWFAVMPPGSSFWEVRDRSGEQVLPPIWVEAVPLNRHLAAFRDQHGEWKVYRQANREAISLSLTFEKFSRLDDRYARCHLRFTVGLLDSLGNEVVPPIYGDIEPFNDTLLRVRRAMWGLLSLRNGLVLPCEYDEIGPFENGLARVAKDRLTGLLDTSLREVVPCYFDRLEVQDSIVKAWDDGKLTIFKMGENGQFGIVAEASNVRTLRIGFARPKWYREAQPVRSTRLAMGLADDIPPIFSLVENTPWEWRRDPQLKLFSLFRSEGGIRKAASPPVFRNVQHVSRAALSLAFDDNRRVVNDGVLPPVALDTLCRMALFDHRQGKFITGFDFLGLRGEDFDRGFPYAAFLDLEGKMGLMDQQGRQLTGPGGQPFRAAYIGEFFEGKARFCVEGRLAAAERPGEEKYGAIKVYPFFKKFGLTGTNDIPARLNHAIVLDSLHGQPPRWGYLDTLGRVVIEPTFEFANDFTDSMAVNQRGGAWGVIGPDGGTMLDFKFRSVSRFHGRWRVGVTGGDVLVFDRNGWQRTSVGDYRRQGEFSEGRCRVQCDSLWGFMDETGQLAIPCHFEAVHDFSEGLAAVRQGGRWFFIEKNGETALLPDSTISLLGDFHEGRCRFKSGHLYGYLDRQGRVAVEPNFTMAFNFQQGVARAVQRRKTGLVDSQGNWVLQPDRFERISDFNELGLATAWEKFNQKNCLLRKDGQVLTPLKYLTIEPWHDGHAAVSNGVNWGLLNRQGREVLPLEFDWIGQVSEGLVNVRPRFSNSWQFYDTLGQVAFPGKFDIVQPFSYGLAEVQVNHFDPLSKMVIDRQGQQLVFKNDEMFQFYSEGIFGIWDPAGERVGRRTLNYCYTNRQGENIFNRFFEKIEPFHDGRALVRDSWRWGVINRNGLFVLPAKYPILDQLPDGSFTVRQPILYGLLDDDGNEIIPPLYDQIELMQGEIYRVENGEKTGYARLDGTWIRELKN